MSKKLIKSLIFILLLLPIVAVILIIFPIRSKDYVLYEELLKSSDPQSSGEADPNHARQKRAQVCKEIWCQDKAPLYCKIESAESELFLRNETQGIAIIEELSDVNCQLLEELYYENEKWMQKLRYIKAVKASYNYSTQLFTAQNVELWGYECEGQEPPPSMPLSSPQLHVLAESLEFSLIDNSGEIRAKNIQLMGLHNDQEIRAKADCAHYGNDQITLIGNICLTHALGTVTANRATLKKDPLHQSKIDFPWIALKEKVRLKLKEGGILKCDHLFIDYTQKTSYFTSTTQLHYQDDVREIYANSAQVDFKEEDKNLQVTKAVLNGEVFLC